MTSTMTILQYSDHMAMVIDIKVIWELCAIPGNENENRD